MTRTIAPVAALLVGVALLLAGNGLQGPLLAVRGQLESFSTTSIGLIGSFYYIGFTAGCILAARLVRRVGHIRTFSAMAAIASAVPLLHALLPLPLPWWVMRSITGFAFAVLYIVIESWLAERSTNETRGTILSVYQIINLTVITLGQMMLTLADPNSFVLFALTSVLVSVAAVPVALTAATAPAPVRSVAIRPLHLYRISPVGFIACASVGLANGTWWALIPIFAAETGLDITGLAVLMSVTVIGGALGQLPAGRLSDRFDRRKVLLILCVVAATVALALVGLGGGHRSVLIALGGIWGVFVFPIYAIAVAHANDFARPEEFVEVSSGLLLVFAGGAVVGPLLAGIALELVGNWALFAFTATVHLLLAAFIAWRMTRRAPAAADEHVEFKEALVATTTVSPVFDAETHPEAQVNSVASTIDSTSAQGDAR